MLRQFGSFFSDMLMTRAGFHVCLHRMCLLIVQKRSPLLVCRSCFLYTPQSNLLSKDAWHCNGQGGYKEHTHDDEGKDPLEGNDLDKELLHAEGGGKDAEGKAHRVVLRSVSNNQIGSNLLTLYAVRKYIP
jgi:hypothetical protein